MIDQGVTLLHGEEYIWLTLKYPQDVWMCLIHIRGKKSNIRQIFELMEIFYNVYIVR